MKIDSVFDTEIKKRGISFSAIIETYLTNREAFNSYEMRLDRNKIIGFHPSMLHNACPRQLAFLYMLEKKVYKKHILEDELNANIIQNNSNLEFIFDIGHITHGLIQYGYLPNINGLEYHVEQPLTTLYDRFGIAGTYDIDVILQDNNMWIGDIKTMLQEKFYKLKSVSEIDFNYIVQINLYMFGRRIPRGFFYIVNKNTTRPQTKEFFLRFDKRVIIEPLEKAILAKRFLLGIMTPKILPECKKREGKYVHCKFSSLCFRCSKTKELSEFITVKQSELFKV